MNITKEQLAQMIDHTNLKAFSEDAAFKKLCEEANQYGFKALAINGAQIERCKKYLGKSQVHIGVTVGFPLGQMTIESKVFETRDAIEKGGLCAQCCRAQKREYGVYRAGDAGDHAGLP